MIRFLTRAFLLALVASPLAAQTPRPAPPFAPAEGGEVTVYRGASLIDGTGAPARPGMAVIVDGPRIKAVLPAAELTPAMTEGARIVDVSGKYLLPGLIDSHEHLATPANPRRAQALMRRDLYGGITAVRIMADDLRSIGELTRQSLVGEIEGPDLHYSVLVAGESFFDDPRTRAAAAGAEPGKVPWMQMIREDTDLREAIAMARGTYATGLKVYANLPGPLIRRIVAEAHRQGMPVWAHGMVFPTKPAEVIAAKPDVISHTCYLAYQLSDPAPATYQDRFPVDFEKFEGGDHPEITRLFRAMKAGNIILDPTLRVYQEMDARTAAGGPAYHCTLDLAARLTNQALREGIEISAGTDGFTPPSDPWTSLHEELELLADRAGMTPLQVIRSATLVGAMTIGKADEMGTVEPGKLANLVVVERDPAADLANLRSVAFTVKRGRQYDRADFRPIAEDEIPAPRQGQ